MFTWESTQSSCLDPPYEVLVVVVVVVGGGGGGAAALCSTEHLSNTKAVFSDTLFPLYKK